MDFDYDPERALWRPSRRAFLFLGGSAALGLFAGQAGLPVAPPASASGWTLDRDLVEVVRIAGTPGARDSMLDVFYAVLVPSSYVNGHGLVPCDAHESVWRLSADNQILWRPAKPWSEQREPEPKYLPRDDGLF